MPDDQSGNDGNGTTTESFYGHLEESFLKSAPAATEAAIRDAARLPAR